MPFKDIWPSLTLYPLSNLSTMGQGTNPHKYFYFRVISQKDTSRALWDSEVFCFMKIATMEASF